MEIAKSLILSSSINFVVLRPSILNEQPKQGYWTSSDKVSKMQISRRDVAIFMVDAIKSTQYDEQAVSLFSV